MLTRAKSGYLAGVAGGIAERTGWDPTIVRLVWLLSVFLYGFGVGLYVLLWWLLPREDQVPREPVFVSRSLSRTVVDRKVAGVFGGIAYHYGVDPLPVRLVGVVLLFVSFGLFAAAYVIAAVIIPAGRGVTIQTRNDF